MVHEGRHEEGDLGGARANAGGDGNARHRQLRLLHALSFSIVIAVSECDEAISGKRSCVTGGLLRCVRDHVSP